MKKTETKKEELGRRASPGYRNEVSWDEGKGSQPYQNRGEEEQRQVNGGDEFAAGARGDLSGRNLEQLEKAKGVPGGSGRLSRFSRAAARSSGSA
ncbi:hypothetical protein [Ramlibacter sp.]|uniref:hypothetical protein n=1 Tax=Ramlibacter sp. TaxID=1917967 RepID=UPI003D136ECD